MARENQSSKDISISAQQSIFIIDGSVSDSVLDSMQASLFSSRDASTRRVDVILTELAFISGGILSDDSVVFNKVQTAVVFLDSDNSYFAGEIQQEAVHLAQDRRYHRALTIAREFPANDAPLGSVVTNAQVTPTTLHQLELAVQDATQGKLFNGREIVAKNHPHIQKPGEFPKRLQD